MARAFRADPGEPVFRSEIKPHLIDVGRIIDHQPFRLFTARVFALCFVAMLSEGYDLGVAGYAAPGLLRQFGMTRPQIAPVFSAALLGMLVGALAAGIVGDRAGRKKAIVVALGVTCLGSFCSARAATLEGLLLARFVVGLGLGGTLPNVTALLAEYLPVRVRGTFSTYAFMGITAGGILPGLVAGLLHLDGWRALFLVGALIPLACVPLVAAFLPESLKFLALRRADSGEVRRWLTKMDPSLALPSGSSFVLDERRSEGRPFSQIVEGRLALVTPMLWVCFVAIMMVNFFVNSWITVLLRDFGYRHGEAAWASSLYYIGGVTGGLLIGVLLDRLGAATLLVTALLGALVTYLLGLGARSHGIVDAMVFLVGFAVLGGQVGMSSLAGMLYPTAVRSEGVGLAHSIGRIGAICGPLFAGVLMGRDASLRSLFMLPAAAMLLAAISFAVITWRMTGRLPGRRFAHLGGQDRPARPAGTG